MNVGMGGELTLEDAQQSKYRKQTAKTDLFAAIFDAHRAMPVSKEPHQVEGAAKNPSGRASWAKTPTEAPSKLEDRAFQGSRPDYLADLLLEPSVLQDFALLHQQSLGKTSEAKFLRERRDAGKTSEALAKGDVSLKVDILASDAQMAGAVAGLAVQAKKGVTLLAKEANAKEERVPQTHALLRGFSDAELSRMSASLQKEAAVVLANLSGVLQAADGAGELPIVQNSRPTFKTEGRLLPAVSRTKSEEKPSSEARASASASEEQGFNRAHVAEHDFALAQGLKKEGFVNVALKASKEKGQEQEPLQPLVESAQPKWQSRSDAMASWQHGADSRSGESGWGKPTDRHLVLLPGQAPLRESKGRRFEAGLQDVKRESGHEAVAEKSVLPARGADPFAALEGIKGKRLGIQEVLGSKESPLPIEMKSSLELSAVSMEADPGFGSFGSFGKEEASSQQTTQSARGFEEEQLSWQIRSGEVRLDLKLDDLSINASVKNKMLNLYINLQGVAISNSAAMREEIGAILLRSGFRFYNLTIRDRAEKSLSDQLGLLQPYRDKRTIDVRV